MVMSIDGGVRLSIDPEYSVSYPSSKSQCHAAMNLVLLTPVLDVCGLTNLTGS